MSKGVQLVWFTRKEAAKITYLHHGSRKRPPSQGRKEAQG